MVLKTAHVLGNGVSLGVIVMSKFCTWQIKDFFVRAEIRIIMCRFSNENTRIQYNDL